MQAWTHSRLIRSAYKPSGRRFLLTLVLGDLAGAYAFCVTTIQFAALSDLWTKGFLGVAPTSWSNLLEGIFVFPIETGILGLWGAFLMLPFTLLTSPIAWLAAYNLKTGAAATVALGAITGLLSAFIMSVHAPVDFALYGSSASAGAAFAEVIWLLCMRPRLAFRQFEAWS